jgi:hypothetical protein
MCSQEFWPLDNLSIPWFILSILITECSDETLAFLRAARRFDPQPWESNTQQKHRDIKAAIYPQNLPCSTRLNDIWVGLTTSMKRSYSCETDSCTADEGILRFSVTKNVDHWSNIPYPEPAECDPQSNRCNCCNRPWRPIGLWDVDARHFRDSFLTGRGVIMSPKRLPPFTPRKIHGTYFC